MNRSRQPRKTPIAALVAGLFAAGMLLTVPAGAQLAGAIVRGQITVAGAPIKPGMAVVAVNMADGRTYRTTTTAGGGYTLVGLAPGSYEIRVTDERGQLLKTEAITLAVGETAAVDLALPAPGMLERVVIVGVIGRKDVRTPEVATSVSREQIEALPQVDRNFLSFADLAPGVQFSTAQDTGYTRLQSGAQNQDNVNLFIDGVGQKNYILRGGISGMDATRGNPFPQSAVSEYKVITQNYKAEFEQVSSAAITAVTKSGTNVLRGDVFWDHTEANWSELNPFQRRAEQQQGIKRPNAKQDQLGFTVGGPIRPDVAHYFFAFERKDIATPRQVVLGNAGLLPNAGIVPSLRALQGATTQEFGENLFFGRADLQLADDQRLTFSARIRREEDLVPESMDFSAPGNDKNRTNNETRADLKHEWSRGAILNEARIGYEDYTWNPRSNATTPFIRYFVSPTNNCPTNCRPVIFTGGSPDAQLRKQSGVYVQNDLTYTGWAGHTIKVGAKLKDMTFDLSGTHRSVEERHIQIDNTTGAPTTFHVFPAIAPAGVNIKNRMLGLYAQDDWQVNRQLEVNYGIRWDYETDPLNKRYVTPADRVTAIFALDQTRWGITPPPGQTYAQSLARGGINIRDFISTGTSRKTFKGAFQPRLGFSYDLRGDRNTVVFGGWGRAYDRAMANHALDERQKNAAPGGEIWLIKNDHKYPFTDQFSLGLRKALGAWDGEVGYLYSHARNQFIWYGGNRDPLGGFANQSAIDPLWGGPAGFGTLILGDFVAQAKTQSVYLKADKPYTKASGWALTSVYTYSDAKTTNREWTNDIFSWTHGKGPTQWYPSRDVAPHRLVVAGLTDRLIPWGVMLSARLTMEHGRVYRITECSRGWNMCTFQKGEVDPFNQVDLALSKDMRLGFGRLNFRFDVLNVFNNINYGRYEEWGGGPGNPQNWLGGDNARLGMPTGMAGPMRTVKLTVSYRY